MDKIEGTERNSGAGPEEQLSRYIAMELAGRGDRGGAGRILNAARQRSDYTAGYFMAAQTLANEARIPEAIEQLKAASQAPKFR